MAAGKFTTVKNDFSGGQIDRTAKRRDDTEIVKSGCLSALNARLIAGGGATWRPGRTREVGFSTVIARRTITARPTPGLRFRLVFTDDRVSIYGADRTLHTTLTGAPWTEAQIADLSFAEIEQSVYVCHQQFRPQVIKYDPVADVWTRASLNFQNDLNNERRQPYFRFAADGVTMQPSGMTGDITVTFSAPTLLPGHVGVRFRYVDRELVITGVTDSTHADATVIDELPPTEIVTIGATAGYSVGDVVEGLDTGAKGEVTAKTSGTLTVVLYSSYNGFGEDEHVIGPHGRLKVEGKAAAPGPGAAIRWDEQFMSDTRGWPGRVDYDLQRVIFSDFAQKPEAIVWSEIAYPAAFRVSGEASGGLFELLPSNCRVLAVVGGADQFVITDRGVYYIPISESNPLKPGSVAFRMIDAVGAARVSPAHMSEGVVFLNDGRSHLMAIVPTGQTTAPYVVRNLTEFHSRLLKAPVQLAMTKGSTDMPESYVYVRNEDGSLVVGKFDAAREWVGWTPWTSAGFVRDINGSEDDLTLTVDYHASYCLIEAQAPAALLDGETPGSSLTALALYDGRTVAVRDPNGYRGVFAVNGSGQLVNYPGDQSTTTVGKDFDGEISPLFENVQGGPADGRRQTRRRLARVAYHVIDSQGFECCGRIIPAHDWSDDGGAAPPKREKTYRFRVLGRREDLVAPIRRRWPGTFTVLEATAEVTG